MDEIQEKEECLRYVHNRERGWQMKKWMNPKRGEGAKDMVDGVGGLNVWWSLVVHPDECRKKAWKKEQKLK